MQVGLVLADDLIEVVAVVEDEQNLVVLIEESDCGGKGMGIHSIDTEVGI